MTSLLLTLMILMSMSIIFSKHPMSLGLTTISFSLMISIFLPFMSNTTWFSLTLFIIFTGGLMVLFIYMTSLASNELFSFPKINMTKTSLFLVLSFMTTTLTFMTSSNHYDTDTTKLTKIENMSTVNQNISTLFNFPMNLLTITLMIFLLITLIAINSITSKKPGPLRSSK